MRKLTLILPFLFIILAGCNQNNEATNNMNDNELMNTRSAQKNYWNNGEFQGLNINSVNRDVAKKRNNYNGPEEISENIQNRYDVAKRAADRVTALDEVNSAYVITMNQNAYVAVVLKDDLTNEKRKEVEGKIVKAVQSTDQHLKNVWISSNPDFVDRIENYVNDVNNNQPIAGFADELTELIQRVFPSRP